MSPNITAKNLDQLPADLRARLEKAAEAGERARARSLSRRTRETYRGEWSRFEQWCTAFGRTPLPADEPTLYAYIADMIAQGRAPSGGRVAVASIKHHHAEQHVEMPTSRRIKQALSGWGRPEEHEDGSITAFEPDKASPFTVAMARKFASLARPGSIADLRDTAMLALGVSRALRGLSELLPLDWMERNGGVGTIEIDERGRVAIKLIKSKTSKIGGEVLYDETGFVVDAIRAWVTAAGIEQGTPLWRTITKNTVTGDRMSRRTLQDVVQRAAERVLRADGASMSEAASKAMTFSTHSLRHGGLTSLGQAGASLSQLREHGRHREGSAKITLGYLHDSGGSVEAMAKLWGK